MVQCSACGETYPYRNGVPVHRCAKAHICKPGVSEAEVEKKAREIAHEVVDWFLLYHPMMNGEKAKEWAREVFAESAGIVKRNLEDARTAALEEAAAHIETVRLADGCRFPNGARAAQEIRALKPGHEAADEQARVWCERAGEAEARYHALLAQLPEGMKHCTILFKSCPVGHGRLHATNWEEHGCPHCKIATLTRERDGLLRRLAEICRKAGEAVDHPLRGHENADVQVERLASWALETEIERDSLRTQLAAANEALDEMAAWLGSHTGYTVGGFVETWLDRVGRLHSAGDGK